MSVSKAMFNKEQKQEYIKYEKMNGDQLRRYFVRLEFMERKYGKDIADMSPNELKDSILNLGIRREESRGHLISLLRGYINWAILTRKTEKTKNAIDGITAANTNSNEIIRQTMIKNPDHLQTILNNSMNYIDYENRSNRDSLLFWLLYNGIDLEDIPSLKKEFLDKETKTVIIEKGKKFNVDEVVVKLWEKCCDMTYIERKNSKCNDEMAKGAQEYTQSMLVSNNYLFRPIEGSKIDQTRKHTLNSLRAIIVKAFQEKEHNIPARNIIYSGKFYKIYLLEQKNGSVTASVFADLFGITYETENEALAKTRKWRKDYDSWKLAFGHII